MIPVRNHIQRLGAWNFPNITVSTCNDDEVENSDYGKLLGLGTTNSDSVTDGNFISIANDIAMNDDESTGRTSFDENDKLNSSKPLPSTISLRRTSDGSDGLPIMSPLVDEKENRTTTADSIANNGSSLRSQNHPPSPFASTTNRNTNNYRTQSPLSTATLATTSNNFAQNTSLFVPKKHLITSTSFDSSNNNINHQSNFSITTPHSISSTSSPRRRSATRPPGSELNSPRYCSTWAMNSTFNIEVKTCADTLSNSTSSISLQTVNEVISASFSDSGRENQRSRNLTKEFLTSTNATDIDEVLNTAAVRDDNNANSLQGKAEKVSVDKSGAAESFYSFDTPPTDVVDLAEKYKWAYEVWSKRGLMTKRDIAAQTWSAMSRQIPHDATNKLPVQKETKNRCQINTTHSKSKSIKPWHCDRTGSFSNLLNNWKSKTDDQPFDSPGSCTVLQQALPLSTRQQQPRKLYSANDHDLLPHRSSVKHTDTELTKSKWKSFSDSKKSPASTISKHSSRHPAASLPIKELDVDSLAEGSISPVPKSQAWKLKARHLSLQHSKEENTQKRASLNPNIDKCNTCTSESCEEVDYNSRSKSNPRGTIHMIEIPDEECSARVASTTGVQCFVEGTKQSKGTDLANVASKMRRSKSQPRERQTFRIAAVKAIKNENIFAELHQKHSGNSIDTKDSLRVIDLNITSGTEDSKFEIDNTSTLLDDETVVLSPYTQRIMRNLAKIYNEGDNVKTPRAFETTMHPWQHDRLLHRVNSISEETNQEECCRCSCSHSVFSGSDDLIEFFLPLMGTGCTCGKATPGLKDPSQPTSLVNILRPWQVDFLSRFGIYCGKELVKSFHRSGQALAKAIVKYRKSEGMTPYPLKSCMMALQIWSKTSKTFVRSIRDQISLRNDVNLIHAEDDKTELKLPNTLYILSSFMEKVHEDEDDNRNSTLFW